MVRRHPILSSNSLYLALGLSLLIHAGFLFSVRGTFESEGRNTEGMQKLTLDIELVAPPRTSAPRRTQPPAAGSREQTAAGAERPVVAAPSKPEVVPSMPAASEPVRSVDQGGEKAQSAVAPEAAPWGSEAHPQGPEAGSRDKGSDAGQEAMASRRAALPDAQASFSELARGLNLPAPGYPELARRWGYEGVTLVEITIGADGRVRSVAVLRSSGHGVLDDACVRVIRSRWRFRPMEREAKVQKEFAFELTR